jgi:hypothetical protein
LHLDLARPPQSRATALNWTIITAASRSGRYQRNAQPRKCLRGNRSGTCTTYPLTHRFRSQFARFLFGSRSCIASSITERGGAGTHSPRHRWPFSISPVLTWLFCVDMTHKSQRGTLPCLLRPRVRTTSLLRSTVIARCWLASLTAATLRFHTSSQRVHQIDHLGRLAVTWRFDFLP